MTGTDRPIRTERLTRPGQRLTGRAIKAELGVEDLCMADLSGMDLSGADLTGENLYAANLTGVNARHADFSGANLAFANSSGAYLRWASLRRARLRGANFSHAYLHDADLHGADLSRSKLRGAMLRGILTIEGFSCGEVQLVPTPAGWHLRVGTRSGLLDDAENLVAPRSSECASIIALCRAHAAQYQNLDNGFPRGIPARWPEKHAYAAA